MNVLYLHLDLRKNLEEFSGDNIKRDRLDEIRLWIGSVSEGILFVGIYKLTVMDLQIPYNARNLVAGGMIVTIWRNFLWLVELIVMSADSRHCHFLVPSKSK